MRSPPSVSAFECLVKRYINSIHYYYCYVASIEEILDDGVGLYLESSGDSLDEDLHIYSDTDQYRKVRTRDRPIPIFLEPIPIFFFHQP